MGIEDTRQPVEQGPYEEFLDRVAIEQARQMNALAAALTTSPERAMEFNDENTKSDWIAYICRYASGACPRLAPKRCDLEFQDAMVKVAALAMSAWLHAEEA